MSVCLSSGRTGCHGKASDLRSAASPTLLVPSSRRSTLGDRSFPVAASRAWNSLPAAVTDTPSLLCFRRRLKTSLFQSSFDCQLSALYFHSVSATDNYVKFPCNNFIKRHFNQYFVKNNNNNRSISKRELW